MGYIGPRTTPMIDLATAPPQRDENKPNYDFKSARASVSIKLASVKNMTISYGKKAIYE